MLTEKIYKDAYQKILQKRNNVLTEAKAPKGIGKGVVVKDLYGNKYKVLATSKKFADVKKYDQSGSGVDFYDEVGDDVPMWVAVRSEANPKMTAVFTYGEDGVVLAEQLTAQPDYVKENKNIVDVYNKIHYGVQLDENKTKEKILKNINKAWELLKQAEDLNGQPLFYDVDGNNVNVVNIVRLSFHAFKNLKEAKCKLTEADITDEKSLKEYAMEMAKEIFGDKVDTKKVDAIVKNAIEKSDGDWGTAAGIVQSSLTGEGDR